MALGGSLDTPQKGWVDATIDQMKGRPPGGVGAGLANGLNGGGLQGAGNWVDQQINGMKGGAGINPAAAGVDISAQGAANWVRQATGSGGAGGGLGGLGGLGGGPQLGALGGNFGGDPLQQQAEAERNRQMMQMMGTAGLAPGGGLGAASPLGGLV